MQSASMSEVLTRHNGSAAVSWRMSSSFLANHIAVLDAVCPTWFDFEL